MGMKVNCLAWMRRNQEVAVFMFMEKGGQNMAQLENVALFSVQLSNTSGYLNRRFFGRLRKSVGQKTVCHFLTAPYFVNPSNMRHSS